MPVLDDIKRDGHSKTRTLTDRLGGVECLKQSFLGLLAHAFTIVLQLDDNVPIVGFNADIYLWVIIFRILRSNSSIFSIIIVKCLNFAAKIQFFLHICKFFYTFAANFLTK